ncbi:MAG: hemerythrin family protein [Rhodospirillales bacterium]|nr:hemerythrin family protein [Rhodospirillales bacterium]
MTLIAWKDEYRTGFSSIDFEHQTMINSINLLYDKITDNCPQETIDESLGVIHALIEGHFALEEKIMQDMAYPGYFQHKEDHDNLLEVIRDIMEQAADDPDQTFRVGLPLKLDDWFSIHFKTHDRKFHSMRGDT